MSLSHVLNSLSHTGRVKAPEYNSVGWDDRRSAIWSPYAYALNLPELGGAQPGALQGRLKGLFNRPNPLNLANRLSTDGLMVQSNHYSFNPNEEYVIAAFDKFVNNGRYEPLFLRLDRDGTWSFKPTGQLPRSRDFRDQPITDPLETLADYGYMPEGAKFFPLFRGYFKAPADLVYAPRMNCPMTLVRTVFETNPPMVIHEHPHIHHDTL